MMLINPHRFGDPRIVLRALFNDSDTSANIIDSTGKHVCADGNYNGGVSPYAYITTAQSAEGGSSLVCRNVSPVFTAPDAGFSNDLIFPTNGSFSVTCCIRRTTAAGEYAWRLNGGSVQLSLFVNPTNISVTGQISMTLACTNPINTWMKFKFERIGNAVSAYKDDLLIGTATNGNIINAGKLQLLTTSNILYRDALMVTKG